MYIGAGEWTRKSVTDWLLTLLLTSQENVRCVMGYIVNLTVILDDIFRTTGGNVTKNAALKVMRTHRKDRIHRDIRSFVTETFSTRFAEPEEDRVLENIIDLIRQYCTEPVAGLS